MQIIVGGGNSARHGVRGALVASAQTVSHSRGAGLQLVRAAGRPKLRWRGDLRVYLYAIPGCAILIAPLVARTIELRPARLLWQRMVRAGVVAALGLSALAGLQGYYGLWPIVVEHRSQIAWGNQLMARERAPMKVMSLYPGGGFSTRSTADYF